MPAAAHTEKDGTFTNTQRLLQWHFKAVEPPGDCRSDRWFTYHLGLRVRRLLADSADPKDRPVQLLAWDYQTQGPQDEPDAETVLQEINGRTADGSFISKYQELKGDGSTTCGSWIHAGIYADGVNQTARKKPGAEQNWIASEWGWSWPANRHILYNRASADPEGSRGRSASATSGGTRRASSGRASATHRTSSPTSGPTTAHPTAPKRMDAINGDAPFILHPDGLGWLFAPRDSSTGRCPRTTSRTSRRSRTSCTGSARTPPARRSIAAENPYNPASSSPPPTCSRSSSRPSG